MDNKTSNWFSVATSNQSQALEVERINDAIAESIKVGNPKTRDQVIKAAKEKGYEILSGASK